MADDRDVLGASLRNVLQILECTWHVLWLCNGIRAASVRTSTYGGNQMVDLILMALSLFGVGGSAAAPTPADKSSTATTTTQSQVPVQPATSDGRTWPPPG